GKGEPGATVTLKDDKGTALGSTTVDKDGNWSITPAALDDTTHNLTVDQTNKAGTTATHKVPAFEVDTQAPDKVSGIAINDDSGAAIDGLTNDSTPTV
ncbi:Ig-like domain-containing protein, partial [Pantoea endophytica]|uniref:Ig-like domain-containing protein n=1 Tax=Pantoea endophytica TaxID=92488 RepID=UPI0030193B4C